MLLILSWRGYVKIQHSSFPLFPVEYPSRIATHYNKREKCKVNDVIFPSGCEARASNLDNKNMKIGIFTASSRYPTGKHEINAGTITSKPSPPPPPPPKVFSYSQILKS